MKSSDDPMRLEDISLLLNEAARLSNHRHYVIAGSLSAIGAVVVAPRDMVMSRDIDLYPKLDPGRGFVEIAAHLSEGSAFAREHGFFADPITPTLLTVPDGWEARLMQVPLANGIVAWFLDPNDAAVSKLVRGAENDVRWVRAGLRAGIVNEQFVRTRLHHAPASQAESEIAVMALQLALQRSQSDDIEVDDDSTEILPPGAPPRPG